MQCLTEIKNKQIGARIMKIRERGSENILRHLELLIPDKVLYKWYQILFLHTKIH